MSSKKQKRNYGGPTTLSYWTIRIGLPEEEALVQQRLAVDAAREKRIKKYGSPEKAKEARGRNCALKRENAIKNRFGGDEAAYQEWKSNTCSLKRENAIKNRFGGDEAAYQEWKSNHGRESLKGHRKNELSYWTAKGFDPDEAAELVRQNGIKNSVRCIEYWINQGFDPDEAARKVSEIQDLVSLKSFIKRYGEDEGKQRYASYIKQKQETTIFNDSEVQRKNSSKTRHKIDFWLELGYSPEEADKQRRKWISHNNSFFVEYWMDRFGYDEEEASAKVLEIAKKGAGTNNSARSQIESEVFDYLYGLDPTIIPNPQIYDAAQERNWFPDIVSRTYVLEVFGDYWHANPKDYNADSTLYKGKLAKDIWTQDKKRITRLHNLTGLPVYYVWERDLKEHGLQILKTILKDHL